MICIVCVVILSHCFQCMFSVIVIARCELMVASPCGWYIGRCLQIESSFFKAFLPTPSQIVFHFGKTSSLGCLAVSALTSVSSGAYSLPVCKVGGVRGEYVCVLTVHAYVKECIYFTSFTSATVKM